jgi:hypothetical protein
MSQTTKILYNYIDNAICIHSAYKHLHIHRINRSTFLPSPFLQNVVVEVEYPSPAGDGRWLWLSTSLHKQHHLSEDAGLLPATLLAIECCETLIYFADALCPKQL